MPAEAVRFAEVDRTSELGHALVAPAGEGRGWMDALAAPHANSDPAPVAATGAPARYATLLLLAGAAVLYVPFAFAGYGSDIDAHGVIENAARALIEEHRYRPSRDPGYFVQEVGETVLNALGGSLLANLGTVAMALAGLFFFLRVLEDLRLPHRHLLAAIMGLTPMFWVTTATTIDYQWALASLLAGYDAWLRRRALLAGVLFGIAVGTRLSSVLIAFVLFGFWMWRGPSEARQRALRMAAAGSVCGAALYIPAWVSANHSFGFLQYGIGQWGVVAYVGRFLYKNIYFWGLAAFVVVAVLAARAVPAALRQARAEPEILVASLIVVAYEALFLKVPLERAYLLPMLPFLLIVLGRWSAPRGLGLLLGAVVLCDLVSLNLARPDVPNQATRAILGPRLEPGEVIADTIKRCSVAITRDEEITAAERRYKRQNVALCRAFHLLPDTPPAPHLP